MGSVFYNILVSVSGEGIWGDSFKTYRSLCQVRASGESVLKHTGLCVR